MKKPTKKELLNIQVFDPYSSYPVLDEEEDVTGWNIYMFRFDDESIKNIINSRYAVETKLLEFIVDYDSFYEDLEFSKESIHNRSIPKFV